MTEVVFKKSVFLKTLDALSEQFKLASPVGLLCTEKTTGQFELILAREAEKGNALLQAFGPCVIKGPDVKVNFNVEQLRGQITATSVDKEWVTLHVGGGTMFVA